jgi:2-polyprenyl-3-methyl-5-hydroxy-6-metoxy-1,4-benzoquinol methylase
MKLQNHLRPMRCRLLAKFAPQRKPLRILDIGCGNSSPTLTKTWFPDCEYHGVDIQVYNQTDSDLKVMDRFFLVSIDGGGYEEIPQDYYDVVMMNHVIEHSFEPLCLLKTAISKLRKDGLIYAAFPSQKSIALPPAQIGTLNFSDDPTHVWLPDLTAVINSMISSGIHILRGGPSREPLRWLIGVAIWPIAMLRKFLTGKLDSKGLWYLYGFESFVIGRKK